MNDNFDNAWRYCAALSAESSDFEKIAAQALLNTFLTVSAFRAGKFTESEIDWGKCLREMREALAAAGHPAGRG